MGSPVLRFEGTETNYINERQLELTVKLIPCDSRRATYGDALAALEAERVPPEDLLGLYKVSSTDSTFQVFLANDTAMTRLLDKKFITNGKVKFSVVSMVEQMVTLRIHWLPLFYDNRILKAIFCDYGEIMDIRMCKSSYANVVAMNGLREVTLRTTELLKQKIPHLVTFDSGQSVLVTMQGRPPLCLKCRTVGHVRKDCTSSQRRSYSQAMQSDSANDVEAHSHGGPVSPVASGAPEGRPAGPSGPSDGPPAPTGGTVDPATGLAEPDGQASGQVVDNSEDAHESDTEMSEEKVGSSKRALEADEDWITPNKTARSRPWSESPGPPSSNPYSQLIVGSGDLEVDDSLPL